MPQSRDVLVRLRADVSDFVAKSQLAKAAVKDLHNEIDKSNDRTAWLAQGILALTPAVTRLGAGAVPVLSGMATQMMLTVAAAGTAALAFNGVGDALTALNDYQLAPTEANLAKLNETMAKIGPSGQALVEYLDSLGPALATISNSAREGMFPGVIDGIEQFMELAPRFNVIVREIGEGLGQLTSEAGAGLSSERFDGFFDYLETRAKPILVEMGRTLGNFTDGLLNMLVAFDPLTAGFSSGLLEMSRSFVAWSEGLAGSNGFQEFVEYVQSAGPDALDFLGSLIMVMVELAEAAAPVGAVLLPMLTGLLDVIGDLANTPLGPATIALLAYTSAVGRLSALSQITGAGVVGKLTKGVRDNATATRAAIPTLRQFGSAAAFAMTSTDALAKSSMSYSQKANQSAVAALRARGAVQNFGRAAAPVAGQVGLLAVAMSSVDDEMGLTNTTSLALAGSLAGPWGAAAGASVGLMMDMRAGADEATAGLKGLDEAINSGRIEDVNARLAQMREELADFGRTDGFRDWFGDVSGDLFTGGAGVGISEVYAEEIKLAEAELVKLKNARQDAFDDKATYNNLMAETAALEANIAAMRDKRAEALRGVNAELDYKASLLDAKDALKENGKTVNENTRAGQANLRALYGMAAGFNAQSDAAKDSAGEVRAARKQFVDMAVAMGMGEDKARDLARELYELPANVPIKIGVDDETARARIRAVKAELESIKDEDVYINVRRVNAGGMGPQVVTEQADGDFKNAHQPEIAQGGAWRVWAEPETQGESYIPHANDYRRPRAKGILEQTARMFGGQVQWYAEGGMTRKGDKSKREFAFMDNTSALEAAIEVLTYSLENQTAAAEATKNALDESTATVKMWADKMGQAGQNTLSQFGLNLFDRPSSPWAQGGGALFNLGNANAGLEQRIGLQQQLGDLGLSGDALSELLKGTNADILGMIQRGEIGQYAAAFAQYQSLSGAASTQAGQLAYGSEYIAAQELQQQEFVAYQKQLNATQAVSAAIGSLEARIDNMADGVGRLASTGPERTGERVAVALRGWGDAAARRRRGEWSQA